MLVVRDEAARSRRRNSVLRGERMCGMCGRGVSLCARLCSVDVKNFKTWNFARNERVAGDRVWWKRETRCVSKQVSSGLDKLFSAGKGDGSLVTRAGVLAQLLPKMERAKQLLVEQKEVDFTDGSFLIAFGVDAESGELVVRLRVIDFGHANWKGQATPRLSEVVGGKKWFKNPGKLTPGKFGCGASELLARLKVGFSSSSVHGVACNLIH